MEENCSRSPQNEYKQIRKDPMIDKIRDSTDCLFIYVFSIIFSTWLGLIIYVFITGYGWQSLIEFIEERNAERHKSLNYTMIDLLSPISKEPIQEFHHQGTNALIIVTGLSLAVTFVLSFFIVLKYFPKVLTRIGIFCIIIAIAKLITEIIFGDPLMTDLTMVPSPIYQVLNSTVTSAIICVTKILFCIFALICLIETEVIDVADIFRQSINAFFYFSYLIFFGLVIMVLEFVIVSLSIVALCSSSMNIIIHYLVLFEGLYLFTFIFYYAKMIITPTITTWFWTQDKSDIPKSSVFKNVASITRYHFGTVSFAALPILPFFMALFIACKNKFDNTKPTFNRIIDVILITYLTRNFIDYSLIISSMYGENLYRSTKKTLRLLTKNSSLSLAFIHILYALLLVGALLVALLAAIPALLWSQITYVPSIFAVILILPIFFLMDHIGQICLLCSFQDDEDDDSSQEITCQTSSSVTLYEISTFGK